MGINVDWDGDGEVGDSTDTVSSALPPWQWSSLALVLPGSGPPWSHFCGLAEISWNAGEVSKHRGSKKKERNNIDLKYPHGCTLPLSFALLG